MANIEEVSIDSLLVEQRIHVAMTVKERPGRRNWKWNNSNTRPGTTNKISCNKIIRNRKRYQMQTVSKFWLENGQHYISVSNNSKRTVCNVMWYSVCWTALQHMQRNRGIKKEWTPTWQCAKISATSYEGKANI